MVEFTTNEGTYALKEYLQNDTMGASLLKDIRSALIQSNTRLDSVVDILTVQTDTLAQQMRTDSLDRENDELRLTEQQREKDRLQQASARLESESTGPAALGSLDTTARGGLLKGLITAGLLGILGTAAYRYFGLDDFKDELAGDEAYDEFKKSAGDKFDSLIFGEDGNGGLVGAIQNNPVASAAAGAGLVAFLMGGAKFKTVPLAMATFMLGYLGLNAFFNPEANQDVADAIDKGIKTLETDFETEFFKIFKEKTGVEITGEGLVNAGTATSLFLGARLAASLFGAKGVKGKLIIPLAGAMAYFAFNYFGLDDFFEPDDEDELFDFLESETLSEFGALIASALAMGTVALTPLALAAGAARAGQNKAPKGANALKPRLLGKSKGLLIASAATAIAAYTFNRLGIADLFNEDESDTNIDENLDEMTEEKFNDLLDSVAVGGAAALALSAARTPLRGSGYVFDRKMQRYRVAPGATGPGGQRPGTFASIEDAKTSALSKYPKLNRLLSKVPGLSAAFAAGSAYYILTDDTLSTSQKVAMVSGEFAGLTVSVLAGAAGALIGGPFAPLTGAIAGIAGYISGDYIVRSLLLWALDAEDQIDTQPAIDATVNRELGFAPGSNPIGEVSSGRLPGMQGNVAPGMEYNALDAISDTDYLYSGGDLPVLGDYDQYPEGTFNDTFVPQYSGPEYNSPQAIPQDDVVPSAELTPREAIEQYLGRPISDLELNYLVRAVYAESSAQTGGDYTVEKGMIMGSILNRARTQYQDHPDGSIIGALVARNQFQAVTGTSANGRQPSPMFLEGPGAESQADIAEAAINILPKVSRDQKDFTAAATGAYGAGTNIGYRDDMIRGGGVTLGGTVFRTAPLPAGEFEIGSLPSVPAIASLDTIDKPTVTPSAMSLATMSNQINMPVTTVVNNIDNSQMIAGRGSGAARTAAARNVRVDTSYTSAAMSRFA